MKPPLQISHIALHQLGGLPQPPGAATGHYQVFWWHRLPLGHLMFAAGKKWTPASFAPSVARAIRQALHAYGLPEPRFSSNEAFAQWKKEMEAAAPANEGAIPAEVPVSLIVCTRNRPDALEKCLRSVLSMCALPKEIIIVDNAPSDDRTQKLARQFSGVRYAIEPTAGLSHARNLGISLAKCPFLAFTDDDVQVHSHWLYEVHRAFEDSAVDALTGMVMAAELATKSQVAFEQRWPFNRGYAPQRHTAKFLEAYRGQGAPVWELGAGANMAFRKTVFSKVGMFDVRLGAGASGCNEDSEMWFRILRNGGTLVYNPAAVVFHEHRRDLPGLKRQLHAYMKGYVAACLVQHRQWPQGGYNSRVFCLLPVYYAKMIRRLIPFFPLRFRTLPVEIRGALAGYFFYLRHCRRTKNPHSIT